MARFHHTAKLVKFPRSSLDDLTHGLLDTLEQFRFADGELLVGDDPLTKVRLVEGEHLAAGARYRIELSPTGATTDFNHIGTVILEAHLQSWDRADKSEVDLALTAEGHRIAMHLELLADNRRLHTVRVDGTYQGPGPLRILQRAALKFEARLGDWWSAPSTARRGLFPVTLHVQHPLARASLRLGLGRAAGKRWSVKTMLEIRGRRLLRPVAAIGLLVLRNRIRRPFRDALYKASTEWNDAVPSIAGSKPREALIFQHRVTVAAISRRWTEDYTMALHETVEGLQFVDGRLVPDARSAIDVRLVLGDGRQSLCSSSRMLTWIPSAHR